MQLVKKTQHVVRQQEHTVPNILISHDKDIAVPLTTAESVVIL